MKYHRPVVQGAVDALLSIFKDGFAADKVLERKFKGNKQWGARDRRLVAEVTYEVTRWWRLLWFELGLPEPEPAVVTAEQIWLLVGRQLSKLSPSGGLPDWQEWKNLGPAIQGQPAALAVRESVPEWLHQRGETELGELWPGLLNGLNQPAPVTLRTNTLRIGRNDLMKALGLEGISARIESSSETALILNERKNVFTSPSFQNGLFEVQDLASQAIAPLLAAEPGQRVIDACAGAGGKTLHLAAIMQNKGKILALDVHQGRLEELKKRAKRGGIDIVETRLIEGSKTVKRLEQSADRLLLDVPCSGLGVLRRNPDAKWKLRPEDLDKLSAQQSEILQNYAKMLKPGGRMVYATCSVLPSENEHQTERFMLARPDYELVEQYWWRPQKHDLFDGFFAAVLQRKP